MQCSIVSVECDDYSVIISQRLVKARKEHKCNECRRTIYPREEYERYVGKMDDIFVCKTCIDCLSVRDEFFKDGFEFGSIWDYMREYIRECGYDIPETSIASLTQRGIAMVCEEIEDSWTDEEE